MIKESQVKRDRRFTPGTVGPIAYGIVRWSSTDEGDLLLQPVSALRSNVRFIYSVNHAKTWTEFFRMNSPDISRELRKRWKENYEGSLGQLVPHGSDPFELEDLGYDDEDPWLPAGLPQRWAYDFFEHDIGGRLNDRDLMYELPAVRFEEVMDYLSQRHYKVVRCDAVFNYIFSYPPCSCGPFGKKQDFSGDELETVLRALRRKN